MYKPICPGKVAVMSKHQEHEEREINSRREAFRIGNMLNGKKPRVP